MYLPDRAAMDIFRTLFSAQDVRDATVKAQYVIYDAWEAPTVRRQAALARKALGISPLCADAFSLLAEHARSLETALDLYGRALEAAELALGPNGFADYAGHFWGELDTRPYMRAKAGLAGILAKLGDEAAAIDHYRAMLVLNPNDNQGIRYILAAHLLRRGDETGLKALLASYKDEWSPYWLYTQALLAFRDGGARNPKAARFARDARAQNPHVPGILAGTSPQVALDSDFITVGGADEASHYVAEFGFAWRETPCAIAWLTGTAAKPAPQRRDKRGLH